VKNQQQNKPCRCFPPKEEPYSKAGLTEKQVSPPDKLLQIKPLSTEGRKTLPTPALAAPFTPPTSPRTALPGRTTSIQTTAALILARTGKPAAVRALCVTVKAMQCFQKANTHKNASAFQGSDASPARGKPSGAEGRAPRQLQHPSQQRCASARPPASPESFLQQSRQLPSLLPRCFLQQTQIPSLKD